MSFNPQKDLKGEIYGIWTLGAPAWTLLVKKSVDMNYPEKKYRDVDWLTSVVFYLHHPERRRSDGSYLPIEKGQTASIAEWKSFQTLIKPLVPTTASTVVAGTTVDPIDLFTYMPIRPMVLRNHRTTANAYTLDAQFQVYLKLNSGLPDPALYEYRQLIRGGGFRQAGMWVAGHWTAMGPLTPFAPDFFLIPGPFAGFHTGQGLTYAWKEDGEIVADAGGTRIRHYGHRDLGGERDGAYRNEYKPDADGPEYFLSDVPEVFFPTLNEDERIKLDMWFQGQVVRFDKPYWDPSRAIVETVRTIAWSYNFDTKITSLTPLEYSKLA